MMSYRRLFLTAAAMSLALAACEQKPAAWPVTAPPIASLPLAQTAPPAETLAPYPQALPPAPPLPRLAHPRRPVYSYIDDAYQLADAFGDSPPDYTVDYEGERPWIWRASSGWYRVVEQTPDGIREYFYRGDSDYPFLIRDTHYCYAYEDGELVEVFDSYGRPYPNYGPLEADLAARYLFRGRRLYDAALHQQRQSAYAGDWRAHREQVIAPLQVWGAEQQRNPDWRRVHEERAQRWQPQQQVAWQQERAVRQAYAARTAPVIAAAAVAPSRQPSLPRDLGREHAQGDAQRRFQPAPDVRQAQADVVAREQFEAQREAGRALGRDRQRGQAEAEAARLNQERERSQFAAQQRDQQRAQADAAMRGRGEAERQQRLQAQAADAAARDQQRGRVEAAQRAQIEQSRQQARAEAQGVERGRQAAERQQQAQAREQQRAQFDAANRARGEVERQQRAQAHEQQRAQAEAANRARGEAERQQQAQAHEQQRVQAEAANRAQHEAERQQQVQAREQQRAQAEAANRAREEAGRQAQAQAAAQQHQAAAQAAQAAAAQHQQAAQAAAAQQHAAAAAAHQQDNKGQPDNKGKGKEHDK